MAKREERQDIRDLIERGKEFGRRALFDDGINRSDAGANETIETELPDEVDDVDENMFPSAD